MWAAEAWRGNRDGVWTRLAVGGTDPENGSPYSGPPKDARLVRGERVLVDEAGMLDQDTALALLTIADEAGATLAFVRDRAQLPAVGRGGVLDMAAQLRARTFDMTTVHRFTDPEYADLTVRMRAGASDRSLAIWVDQPQEPLARDHHAAAEPDRGDRTVFDPHRDRAGIDAECLRRFGSRDDQAPQLTQHLNGA